MPDKDAGRDGTDLIVADSISLMEDLDEHIDSHQIHALFLSSHSGVICSPSSWKKGGLTDGLDTGVRKGLRRAYRCCRYGAVVAVMRS